MKYPTPSLREKAWLKKDYRTDKCKCSHCVAAARARAVPF